MKNHVFAGLLLAGILTAPLAAQMPSSYLDIDVVKVKMGKRAEFDSLTRKMVDLNRKNKGDNWLTFEIMYGTPNEVYFTSTRNSLGAIEEATKSFEGAMSKTLGSLAMHKLFNDWDATLESEHTELRTRRWDLSASAPADLAAYNKFVGESRFIRTVIVRVRPGRVAEYETQLKIHKTAQERANPGYPVLVSQSIAGGATGVFYISSLVKSLSEGDKVKSLQEVLGSSYASYQKVVADTVLGTEIIVGRFLPELSNPPDEVVATDPKYWRPAPPAAPKPKPAEAAK